MIDSHAPRDVLAAQRRQSWCLIVLLVAAAAFRLGLFAWQPPRIAEDRDLYLGIGRALANGQGFVHPDTGTATAYRPPLYPVVLAVVFFFFGGGVGTIVAMQTALSLATVWLTCKIGQQLGLGAKALIGAAFVAANPLLVQATTLAMTETLCTFLVIASLWLLTDSRPDPFRRLLLGFCVGLAALCRPTIWAFVFACVAIDFVRNFRSQSMRRWPDRWWTWTVIGCTVVVSPWAIRNTLVFGKSIVTTTHGGYTLLLGNNESAYTAEVAQPGDALWDSRAWQQQLEAAMIADGVGPADEIGRDRWMKRRAWKWISDNPREFVASCWLRVRRFWSVMPSGTDVAALPFVIRVGVAIFFGLELCAAAAGCFRLRREEWRHWWPMAALIASFALVHVVYWSNLRMRAPVEPAIALLAARAFRRPDHASSNSV